MGPNHGFDAILPVRQISQKLKCLYAIRWQITFTKTEPICESQCKKLGKRLHSPGSKDQAWLEDPRFLSVNSVG